MRRRTLPLVMAVAAALGASLGASLGACRTVAADSTAASVDLGDAATRAAVTSALAAALGRGHIELGPVNDAATSVVSVLPPKPGPYEMNATARPVTFDITFRDGRCVAVRRDTGAVVDLPGITCKAV